MALSHHDKQKVTNILTEVLSAYSQGKTSDEHIHFCPFCHHHKKKMNINVETQAWHCWVCDAKGRSIFFLLQKLNVDKNQLNIINKIYGTENYTGNTNVEEKIQLLLPKEFVSLNKQPKGLQPAFKNALSYLKKRGITKEDIIKYNIGFCTTGIYAGRIIIPSYDENGILNYFIARTIFDNEDYKYKNPPVSKNIIALGNHIDWSQPITLVEGIFDAIAVKRNVIPLFGKFISKELMNAIFLNKVKHINILLDEDAQKQALYYTEYFAKQEITVINIKPTDKDPSEMGFKPINQIIKTSKESTFEDLISQKLNSL